MKDANINSFEKQMRVFSIQLQRVVQFEKFEGKNIILIADMNESGFNIIAPSI